MIFETTRKVIFKTIDETLSFFDTLFSPYISMDLITSHFQKVVHFFTTLITFLIDSTKQKIHSSAHVLGPERK
jgi:hypothetical protein